jgi:hypothetical protein
LMPSEPAGIRTQDPYIKSVLLYRLSYQFGTFWRHNKNGLPETRCKTIA